MAAGMKHSVLEPLAAAAFPSSQDGVKGMTAPVQNALHLPSSSPWLSLQSLDSCPLPKQLFGYVCLNATNSRAQHSSVHNRLHTVAAFLTTLHLFQQGAAVGWRFHFCYTHLWFLVSSSDSEPFFLSPVNVLSFWKNAAVFFPTSFRSWTKDIKGRVRFTNRGDQKNLHFM